MIDIELNDKDQQEIRIYFTITRVTNEYQTEFYEFIKGMPFSFQQKIQFNMFFNSLIANPILSEFMINMFKPSNTMM
jgi:hypothetical protein